MGNALLVAAPRSGAGKTTVTLALLAAFRRRGLRVRAAKAGPDYIDPAFHAVATGADCANLDSWAMPPALLDDIIGRALQDCDLLIIEAAMGLFDGVAGPKGATGRAADLAARYRLPVLLVLDVSGQSQSAAAVARGFVLHDPLVAIAGVVLNRVGSARHQAAIATALVDAEIPLLGALPRDPQIALPERHLGLVQAAEQSDALPRHLAQLAALAERGIDLDRVRHLAGGAPAAAAEVCAIPPPGQRIAVAQDVAFGFLYPHVLQGWRRAGAELSFFSPLQDEAPAPDADACWLPGGYPELHGGLLAAAGRFRSAMTAFAGKVHGECGGYMVLGRAIEDAAGKRHEMLGLLDHVTSFARRELHLGYRQARLLEDGILGQADALLRGHEFHYATVTDPGRDRPFAQLSDAAGADLGPAGSRRGQVSGSFFHVISRAGI